MSIACLRLVKMGYALDLIVLLNDRKGSFTQCMVMLHVARVMIYADLFAYSFEKHFQVHVA